jgi:hypothetical protein
MKKKKTEAVSAKLPKSAPQAVPAQVSAAPALKEPKAPSDRQGRPPAAAARAPKAPRQTVTVDFPLEREIVTSAEYTVRISTTAVQGVEVSIDGKEWRPARESVGFWWYDWSGYGAGPHTVEARIPSGKRFLKSKPRQFTAI